MEIDHGNGNFTLYAHMSERLVEVGEYVEQGEVIGLCGSTGISTGPHVHYEIWENYTRINPLNRLPGYIPYWGKRPFPHLHQAVQVGNFLCRLSPAAGP